jgi:glutathione S-transferase
VLVHDGNTIVESSVICSYLDEVFPNPSLSPNSPVERATMRLWCKLPDDILHMACATVSFAISFGQQLKKQAGAGLEERLMKMPDPARRERQRALIEKGIETPFFRDHIKVFEKTVAEMEAQLTKTMWLASDMYTLADAEITPYVERADRLGLAGLWERRPRVATSRHFAPMRNLVAIQSRPDMAELAASSTRSRMTQLGTVGEIIP